MGEQFLQLITDNKIDARISFIRTFEHFDIIMVIIIIYISTTIDSRIITYRIKLFKECIINN